MISGRFLVMVYAPGQSGDFATGAVADVVEIGWWRSLWFVQRTISGVRAPAETTPWKRLVPLHSGFDCLGVSGIERGQVSVVYLDSDAPSRAGLA